MCDCQEYEFESVEESEELKEPAVPAVTIRAKRKQDPIPMVVST